jgi:hypothetical protein
MILGFLFGKEFMDETKEKKEKSIKNLKNYLKENDNILETTIDADKLKNLEPKKLEKFYSYLDSKKIDYSTDKFWEEILT